MSVKYTPQMSGLNEGQPHANRSISHPMYLSTGDPGPSGGGLLLVALPLSAPSLLHGAEFQEGAIG